MIISFMWPNRYLCLIECYTTFFTSLASPRLPKEEVSKNASKGTEVLCAAAIAFVSDCPALLPLIILI